jgi:hypothetical protein
MSVNQFSKRADGNEPARRRLPAAPGRGYTGVIMDPKPEGQWPGNGRIWARASLPDVLAAVRRAAGEAGWHTVTYADGGFYFFGYFFGHTQDWGSAELWVGRRRTSVGH